MRVLITGAGGNLGRCATPVLERAGHQLRLLDFRALSTPHDFVEADVRDREAVRDAMEGVDAVVHGAALHGVHMGVWPAEDFWSINVDGTFNVYESALLAGVQHVVLASSMAIYGIGAGSRGTWPVVTEQTPSRPRDLYGLTKLLAEHTADFYARAHELSTVALRLGMFVPETFERYGFRLLFGGVDDRDLGQAVLLALQHKPDAGFAAFNVMADNGLGPDDAAELTADLSGALERRWPGVDELVRNAGGELDDLVWGGALHLVDEARTHLGWTPRYDFTAFMQAWSRGDTSHYPYSAEPWWGMQRRAT